jgi:hypothetical protein
VTTEEPRGLPAFYLDANISPRVARIARGMGVDALALAEDPAMDHSADDDEVLERATERGRWVVTYNRADFVHLAQAFAEQGWRYRGIVLVSPRIPGDGFPRMADLLADFAAAQPDVDAYGFGSLTA